MRVLLCVNLICIERCQLAECVWMHAWDMQLKPLMDHLFYMMIDDAQLILFLAWKLNTD